MSPAVSSLGTGKSSVNGTALGASVSHPPSPARRGPPPSQGAAVEALRPAWASCTAGTAPCSLMKAATGRSASAWASDHRPRSPGEILPPGETEAASVMTSPAPPTARLPR